MIIRATSKALKLSGIKPVVHDIFEHNSLPGEWFAGIFSLGKPGKLGTYFVHQPTKISVLVPGKSLKNTISKLPERVKGYLQRNGYEQLLPLFHLDTSCVEIYTTNSRSVLAHMNQIKFNIEYHCFLAETLEQINFDWLEDIFFDYLFQTKDTKGKYTKTKEILSKLLVT